MISTKKNLSDDIASFWIRDRISYDGLTTITDWACDISYDWYLKQPHVYETTIKNDVSILFAFEI